MKRLITHESLAHIGHLKNLLEHSGIVCVIRNDQLSGGLGEIPFLECLPELWVVRAQDLPLIGGGDSYYANFAEAGGS